MPTCPQHAENEATYRWGSCGKPYCERCVAENGYDTILCPECEALVAVYCSPRCGTVFCPDENPLGADLEDEI